jgi:hypothetical protein
LATPSDGGDDNSQQVLKPESHGGAGSIPAGSPSPA